MNNKTLLNVAATLIVGAMVLWLIFGNVVQYLRQPEPVPHEKVREHELFHDEKVSEREVGTAVPRADFHVIQVLRRYGVSTVYEYVVTCTAPGTGRARGEAKDFVPPGSVLVDRVSYIDVSAGKGENDLARAASIAAASVHSGPGWIAWMQRDFRLSLDGCATWIEFRPAQALEPRLVASGTGTCSTRDCVQLELHNNGVFFSDVKAERNAAGDRVSFVMNSTGLAGAGGLAVATEDGGRIWHVSERDAPADAPSFQPDPSRYVNGKPEPAKPTPGKMHALTAEEFAAIPRPPLDGLVELLFVKIRESALAGRSDSVRTARVKDLITHEGEPVEEFRTAVLAAMDAKAGRLSAPEAPPRSSPYALTGAEIAQVAPPRLEGPTIATLVSDMQSAAGAGDQSRLMSLAMEATHRREREEIDRYAAALMDAMVAKAAKPAAGQGSARP